MKYEFGEFVHAVQIESELIVLDEVSDRYLFLSADETQQLNLEMMGGSFLNGVGSKFLELGILKRSDGAQLFPINQQRPLGIDAYAWAHRSEFVEVVSGRLYDNLVATVILLRIILSLRHRGLHFALNMLRHLKKSSAPNSVSDYEAACYMAGILKNVAPFAFGRVRCLEMALSLSYWCQTRGVSTDFIIGVQKYDFLSHAWVECDGRVIADSPALQLGLCEILRI